MLKKVLGVMILSLSLFAMGRPSLVEVAILKQGVVNPLQEFTGTLNFDMNSQVAAQNSGVVEKIYFEIGDRIKKGTILVQIDTDVLDAQIKAAKANVQSAKKDFKRYTKLLNANSISQKQFDDIQLNFITTQSRLEELEIQKIKKSIKAPFDGIVTEKNISLGEWVNAGSKLLSIVNVANVDITFNVPLNIVNGLQKGDIYDINVGNTILKGKLQAAIPSGDKLTRTFPVRFKANTNKNFLFDGQQAKVQLSENAKQKAMMLPRDAVIKRFGQNVVFYINDKSMAVMIPVQIVGYVNKQIAVSGQGLIEGMQIVSKGNERVFPNTPVKIINNK